METIDRITEGFSFLQNDCRYVRLMGFKHKIEIPEDFVYQKYDDDLFDHEYARIQTDYWDGSDFWGEIYLPLINDVYMCFEVRA